VNYRFAHSLRQEKIRVETDKKTLYDRHLAEKIDNLAEAKNNKDIELKRLKN